MSIKIMSRVWEAEGLKSLEKLVLIALADHANDEGVCYPSVGRVRLKTSMSERGVQKTIRNLEAMGWLRIEQNGGPRGCNVFTILFPQKEETPPHGVHPPHSVHPAPCAPTPRTVCTPTPAPCAPEPSFNHQEPVESLPPPPVARSEREEILVAAGHDPSGLTATGRIVGCAAEMIEVRRWRDDLDLTHAEVLTVIGEVMAQKRDGPITTLKYFTRPMQRFAAEKTAEKLKPSDQQTSRGTRNDTRDSNAEFYDLADQLSAGTAHLDTSSRDPFAQR